MPIRQRFLGRKTLEADVGPIRTWMGTAGGSGPAPLDAQYVVLAVDADLTQERVLTAGDGVDLADTGAGGTVTVSVDVTDIIGIGLSEDISNNLVLGTPSNCTATSTNTVSGTTHTHAIDATLARSAITITAGAGLTGGGDLTANRTLTVGAGNGITVNADDVALTTPGTCTVTSTNTAAGNHTHEITSSPAPGAAQSLLATTAAGLLTLQSLIVTTGVTINESGADSDTRIESDTKANMVFVDAGANCVYINSSATDAEAVAFDTAIGLLSFDNMAVTGQSAVTGVTVFHYSNTATDVPAFRVRRARGTRASPTAPQSGDKLGRFGAGTFDGTDFTASVGFIDFYATENHGAAAQGTDARIFTTPDGATTPVERLRIAQGGNMGLGETVPSWGVASPERAFHVSYSGDGYPAVVLERKSAVSHTNQKMSIYIGSGGGLTIYDNTNTAARLVVLAAGNIGIGSTAPDTKLDVAGAITFRELSADPGNPDEGAAVLWMSDGTGAGDDGDILMKVTAGAATKTVTLVDFSAV